MKPKKSYSAKAKKRGDNERSVPLHELKVQITGLDLAFCFERDNEQVCQVFNVQNCEFAPEVNAGLPQGHAVDVWGLGLVTVTLLNMTDLDYDHPLQLLAMSML